MKQRLEAILKRRILAIVGLIMTIQGMTPFLPVRAQAATTDALTIAIGLADAFPPRPVTDLTASTSGTEGQLVLTWTSPSEDNLAAPSATAASQYVIRV